MGVCIYLLDGDNLNPRAAPRITLKSVQQQQPWLVDLRRFSHMCQNIWELQGVYAGTRADKIIRHAQSSSDM